MTRALGIVWLLGILVNACCYAALHEQKPVVIHAACDGAFQVLASALQRPGRVR